MTTETCRYARLQYLSIGTLVDEADHQIQRSRSQGGAQGVVA
jgi:hypothetical protein